MSDLVIPSNGTVEVTSKNFGQIIRDTELTSYVARLNFWIEGKVNEAAMHVGVSSLVAAELEFEQCEESEIARRAMALLRTMLAGVTAANAQATLRLLYDQAERAIVRVADVKNGTLQIVRVYPEHRSECLRLQSMAGKALIEVCAGQGLVLTNIERRRDPKRRTQLVARVPNGVTRVYIAKADPTRSSWERTSVQEDDIVLFARGKPPIGTYLYRDPAKREEGYLTDLFPVVYPLDRRSL